MERALKAKMFGKTHALLLQTLICSKQDGMWKQTLYDASGQMFSSLMDKRVKILMSSKVKDFCQWKIPIQWFEWGIYKRHHTFRQREKRKWDARITAWNLETPEFCRAIWKCLIINWVTSHLASKYPKDWLGVLLSTSCENQIRTFTRYKMNVYPSCWRKAISGTEIYCLTQTFLMKEWMSK